MKSADKGISVGENSVAIIGDTIVSGAYFGIAIKDGSLVSISGGEISDTIYAIGGVSTMTIGPVGRTEQMSP